MDRHVGRFHRHVTTAYDANFTTVTDQAGKVRRSMIDALGRLRRVDEPDAAGNLGSTASPVQPTSYAYDVFGNLTTVTQGSQTRTFTYDSLVAFAYGGESRKRNISYQYDDNGNLIVKTDARPVSTHFEYDALNRVTRRWYNGSNSVIDSPTTFLRCRRVSALQMKRNFTTTHRSLTGRRSTLIARGPLLDVSSAADVWHGQQWRLLRLRCTWPSNAENSTDRHSQLSNERCLYLVRRAQIR